MTTWFHPSVDVQRAGEIPSDRPVVIQRGDLLWTDFCTIAMNLHTDTQHLGYVFSPGETEVPAGLRQCIQASNRMQDILLEEMEVGRTGNEILAAALTQMEVEGIRGTIYTHPIGFYGHGSGMMIGMTEKQEFVPGTGDHPLYPDTVYSIELSATATIPEWENARVSMGVEDEAVFTKDGARWVDGYPRKLYLIK